MSENTNEFARKKKWFMIFKTKENILKSESSVPHLTHSDSHNMWPCFVVEICLLFHFTWNGKPFDNFICVKTKQWKKKKNAKKNIHTESMFFGQYFACTSKFRRNDAGMVLLLKMKPHSCHVCDLKSMHVSEIECTITYEFHRLSKATKTILQKYRFLSLSYDVKWQFRWLNYNLPDENWSIKIHYQNYRSRMICTPRMHIIHNNQFTFKFMQPCSECTLFSV